MGLSWTKKHVATIADVLDTDHATLDDAAKAVLDTALAIIEDRAKWAVVGQVVRTLEHGDIPGSHPQAAKVCLGFFETDTRANDAAAALTSNAAGDTLNTWVVPTFFGTAAGWHGTRREHYAAMQDKANEKRLTKLRQSIEDRQAAMGERAREIQAMEEKAGQQWPCPSKNVKAGTCKHVPTCK